MNGRKLLFQALTFHSNKMSASLYCANLTLFILFHNLVLIYINKFLHSDWLRAVQFFFLVNSAKRGSKPSILIVQLSKKLIDNQSNLLLSNQVLALDGTIFL